MLHSAIHKSAESFTKCCREPSKTSVGQLPRGQGGQYRGDEGVLDLAILAEQLVESIRVSIPRDVADVPAHAAESNAHSVMATAKGAIDT